jgi:hypothetical protein
MTQLISPSKFNAPIKFWAQHREVSLNLIAFGLLLAAWNASDNDATATARRPESLRNHPYVTVRAAARIDVAAH